MGEGLGVLTEVQDFHKRGEADRGWQSQSTEVRMPLACASRDNNPHQNGVCLLHLQAFLNRFEPLNIYQSPTMGYLLWARHHLGTCRGSKAGSAGPEQTKQRQGTGTSDIFPEFRSPRT